MKITRYLLIALLFSASVLSASAALANQCVELSQIPAHITKAGCYALKTDISVSDPHTDTITIEADDVEIDLNGHKVINSGGAGTSSSGIYANSVRNLSIKNGQISGYLYAIRIDGGSNGRSSENINVSGITASNNYFRGLSIEAINATVEKNRVDNTGGTVVFPDAFAIAIELKGDSCIVKNNFVNDVDAAGVGEGIGISLSSARESCDVSGNSVKSSSLKNSTFGIWLSGESSPTIVEKNKIEGFTYPFSIPRATSVEYPASITVRFSGNLMKEIPCNPSSFGSYFSYLPTSNKFIDNPKSCPVLISEILKRKHELNGNATANFRLATAMYQCADEPRLSKAACCKMQEASLEYFEKAGDLGLAEAKRVLPGVTNAVRSNPRCQ